MSLDDQQGPGGRMSEAAHELDKAVDNQGQIAGSNAASAAMKMQQHDTKKSLNTKLKEQVVDSEEDGDQDKMTFAKLFLSGADAIELDDTENAGEGLRIRRSWQSNEDQMPSTFVDFREYIVDPPCVMPFEGEEEDEELAKSAQSLQHYWKDHADWLHCWPKIKQSKEAMDEFEAALSAEATGRLRPFVVVSMNSVGVRSQPTMDESAKTGEILRPGQCCLTSDVRQVDGVRFLKLHGDAGWVFEAKGDLVVLSEMKSCEVGRWWYRVVCAGMVECRKTPCTDNDSRNGWVLCPGEFAVVRLRCRVGGCQYFSLCDGRGWAFALKPGTHKNNKDWENVVLHECEDDFIVGSETAILQKLVPPTNEVVEIGMWTYIVDVQPVLAVGTKRNGTYLTPGDVVKVDKRAIANGNPRELMEGEMQNYHNRRWLRLADKRGWVPEFDPKNNKILLVEQVEQEVSYPSWWKGNKRNADRPKEAWMSGIV